MHGHGYYSGKYREYKGNGKTTSKNRDYRKNQSVKQYSRGSSSSDAVFDSGMTVMDDVDIIIPEKVRDICISIQNAVGRPEWGALFKGEWTDNGFEVIPEYVIPEQTVSRAHIDYDEDLKKFRDDGYVVNVHSHPFSGRSASFSGTDDEHINSHFDVALLYAGNAEDIVDGLLNLTVKDGVKVQLGGNVKVKTDRDSLPDVDIDNIQERSHTSTKYGSQSDSSSDATQQSVTESVKQRFQSDASENEEVSVKSTVKIPESDLNGHIEDFDGVEGVEIIPEEEEENPENGDKEE